MKSQILIIFFVVCVAAVIGVFVAVVNYRKLAEAEQEVRVLEDTLANQEKSFSELRLLKENLKAYESEVKKINAAFPEEEELPSLYGAIEEMAGFSGAFLQSLSAVAAPDPQHNLLELVNVNLEIVGPYDALKQFIKNVNASPRILNIYSVDIFSTENDEGSDRLTAKIDMEAYAVMGGEVQHR